MEFLGFLLIAAFLWYIFKPRRRQPAPPSEAHRHQTPTPGPRTPEPPSSPRSALDLSHLGPEDNDQSRSRYALRQLCREALGDKVISTEEAVQLLEAFQGYHDRYPNTSTHIEYILYQLKTCLDDGEINTEESLELVNTLGEFTDFGLYRPTIADAQVRSPAPRKKTARKPRESKGTKPAAATHIDGIDGLQIDGRYLMRYTDADGDPSEREVKPKRLEQRGDHLYLVTYCYSARGPRTFRVDRIHTLTDTETGEMLVV